MPSTAVEADGVGSWVGATRGQGMLLEMTSAGQEGWPEVCNIPHGGQGTCRYRPMNTWCAQRRRACSVSGAMGERAEDVP